MSGDSVPFALPLARFGISDREATPCFVSSENPCCDTWFVWGFPTTKRRTSFRTLF